MKLLLSPMIIASKYLSLFTISIFTSFTEIFLSLEISFCCSVLYGVTRINGLTKFKIASIIIYAKVKDLV